MGSSKPGSPPRVRGKVRRVLGKLAASVDHPRVCGEKDCSAPCAHGRWGSPPRVRGKERCGRANRMSKGITPACAGKSAIPCFSWLRCWDHPRVCGEKNVKKLKTMWKVGSPPRVRGKDKVLSAFGSAFGITPACAGKRLKRSHSIGHFSCILCLFHSVLHRASVSGGSRAGPCAPPCLPAQNAVPV